MGLETHEREAAHQNDVAPNHAAKPPLQGERGGTQAIRKLLAHGEPDPAVVASVIAQFPGDASEIFSLLHTTLGNRFVSAVLESTQASSPATPTPLPAPTSLGDLGIDHIDEPGLDNSEKSAESYLKDPQLKAALANVGAQHKK